MCLLALPRASWYAGHSFPPSCLDSRQLPAQGGECEQGPLDLAYSLVHLGLASLMLSQVKCGRQGVLRVSMAVGHVTRLVFLLFKLHLSRDPCLEFRQHVSLHWGPSPFLLHPSSLVGISAHSNRNMHIVSRGSCMGSVVGPLS